VLGRLLTPPEREAPVLGRRTELVREGLFPEPLIDGAREGVDGGRLTVPARAGFARGWLTMALLGRDRGTVRVSDGPAAARPIVVVRAARGGGR
jgi:hypothetical protein